MVATRRLRTTARDIFQSLPDRPVRIHERGYVEQPGVALP